MARKLGNCQVEHKQYFIVCEASFIVFRSVLDILASQIQRFLPRVTYLIVMREGRQRRCELFSDLKNDQMDRIEVGA